LRVILCLEFEPHAQPERVAALKNAFIESPQTLHSVETTGDFDFMSEIAAPDLGWFNRWWKTLAGHVAAVVRRCEKSFVCKRFVRRTSDQLPLWVRCGDEVKRIEPALIDKVVAEGDYARVFSQGQSWLLHATMHSLHERLSSHHFVQLHRSLIVRTGFIDRLIHEGRHWNARLRDGTLERVARSHVSEARTMTHSAMSEPHSSKLEQIVEPRPARLTKT
jgi:hypothetical protein